MNILTFDIEEWFHILDNYSTKTESDWSNYESRIHRNVDKIFELIDNSGFSATFFIVGWIAKKYPDVVKRISNAGYEIGSHTNMHQLIYEQKPMEFSRDLEESINTLEHITGEKVRSFRAPGFSITEKNIWAFEILHKNGITHDCSVFPSGRAHGGFPSYGSAIPTLLKYNGIILKEFPINTANIFGNNWIFSGGGYFRLSPYYFIKKWTINSNYVMTYFHPRDFDPNQPIIPELNSFRKFKTYIGLKSCYNKLEKWLKDFQFVDLNEADLLIDWKNIKVIDLN